MCKGGTEEKYGENDVEAELFRDVGVALSCKEWRNEGGARFGVNK